MTEVLAKRINDLPGKPLIVIDEGGHFKQNKLGLFHDLYNIVEGKCGIAICAPYYFQENVLKWIKNRVYGIEEFSSRVSYWSALGHPTNVEIKAVFNLEGLTGVPEFDQILKDLIRTKKSSLSWRSIYNQIAEKLQELKMGPWQESSQK